MFIYNNYPTWFGYPCFDPLRRFDSLYIKETLLFDFFVNSCGLFFGTLFCFAFANVQGRRFFVLPLVILIQNAFDMCRVVSYTTCPHKSCAKPIDFIPHPLQLIFDHNGQRIFIFFPLEVPTIQYSFCSVYYNVEYHIHSFFTYESKHIFISLHGTSLF